MPNSADPQSESPVPGLVDSGSELLSSIGEANSPENDPNHSRNLGLGVFYMTLMRIGWIFKTESIIMPAVLDVIGGAGWLRGCLPMLNRFGQSIPPLLASDRIRDSRFKKKRLFSTTLTMGLCFLALSLIWLFTDGRRSWWLPFAFLMVYGIFFAATGINQLLLHTITGKLIRVTKRGLLSLLGTVFGAAIAVVCAWYLLRRWLVGGGDSEEQPWFGAIFCFTGVMFIGAAVCALFLKERPDVRSQDRRTVMELFKASFQTLRTDKNFRMVAIVAAMFGMYLTLLPHYQRLGRDRLSLSLTALIPWVIAQNIGAAMFSIPSGWVADRFGNRLVLRMSMILLAVPPILTLVLIQFEDAGPVWFTVVFFLLGLTPVAIRYLNNYTLEVCESEDHPRYLSTLGLAISAPPILFSSLMGAMVDWISFEFVFAIGIICIILGWILTFRIEEPRHE